MATPPSSLFHALLRPTVLQILRATGYHSTRPAVLDSVTDLAARYLSLLCEATARHAVHNHGDGADFELTDVRLALEEAGALLPQRGATEEMWRGEEDLRGVEEFVRWFAGQRMKEMMAVGAGDGETDATDYLNALKKKHSKTADDAKYQGTIIGRGLDAGEVQVEGGPETSIDEWIAKRSGSFKRGDDDDEDEESRRLREAELSSPASSGLSSLGSRMGDDEEMDLS